MADEEAIDEGEIEDVPSSGKLKKIIMMIVGVILIAGVSILSTWFMLKDKMAAPEETDVSEIVMEEPIMDPSQGEAIYHALQPAFIVNFNSNGKSRFLQVELTVLTRDPESVEVLILHNPLIRNNLLDVFTLHNIEQLITAAGKEQLAEDLGSAIEDILIIEMGRPGIESVLFRSFILQ